MPNIAVRKNEVSSNIITFSDEVSRGGFGMQECQN